jgi:hypothetical protein
MGVALIAEVMDQAPADLTSAEVVVLLVLAENANDTTRKAWPGLETLLRRARLSPTGLRTVFQRLAGRGLEVRVPIGHDKAGRPVYAARGRQTVYRIPLFAPEGDVPTSPSGAQDGDLDPAKGDAATSPMPEKADADTSPIDGEGDAATSPMEPKGDAGWSALDQKGDAATSPIDDKGDALTSPNSGKGDATTAQRRRAHVTRATQPRRPSPQGTVIEPSSTPTRERADDDLMPKPYGEDPRALPEPLRTIMLSLTATDPGATLDEARAVGRLVASRHAPKTVTYYARVADGGGFGGYLVEVRRTRAVQTEKTLQRLRRTEPPCEHGEPAGRSPHPVHGTPLCPDCRRGAPAAPEPLPDTDPGVADVVTAYRTTATAAGRWVNTLQLVQITSQATRLLAAGATPGQLTLVAQAAATAGVDLITQATHASRSAA